MGLVLGGVQLSLPLREQNQPRPILKGAPRRLCTVSLALSACLSRQREDAAGPRRREGHCSVGGLWWVGGLWIRVTSAPFFPQYWGVLHKRLLHISRFQELESQWKNW